MGRCRLRRIPGSCSGFMKTMRQWETEGIGDIIARRKPWKKGRKENSAMQYPRISLIALVNELPTCSSLRCTFGDAFLKNLTYSSHFCHTIQSTILSSQQRSGCRASTCGGSGKQPCQIWQQHHRRFPALYEKHHQIRRIGQYYGACEKSFLPFIFYLP